MDRDLRQETSLFASVDDLTRKGGRRRYSLFVVWVLILVFGIFVSPPMISPIAVAVFAITLPCVGYATATRFSHLRDDLPLSPAGMITAMVTIVIWAALLNLHLMAAGVFIVLNLYLGLHWCLRKKRINHGDLICTINHAPPKFESTRGN